MNFLYVCAVTEHEQGWGQRPDGYFLFETEEKFIEWKDKKYANRTDKNVPYIYDTYEGIGYHPVADDVYREFVKRDDDTFWVKHYKK